MMFWYGDGVGGWGYALMAVGMIAFWVILIVGIVYLVRAVAGPPSATGVGDTDRSPDAESVLAQRYARGQIDEQEYRQRLQTLRELNGG